MLDLIKINKTFYPGTPNENHVLHDLSLHLDNGDFITVIGGNGAGKSTMLNIISGQFFPETGQVIIDGQDVTWLPEHKRAVYLGRVFQDPMQGTAGDMGIDENLAWPHGAANAAVSAGASARRNATFIAKRYVALGLAWRSVLAPRLISCPEGSAKR